MNGGHLPAVTSDASSSSSKRTAAQRQAAYRARKGRQVVVLLPDDLKAALDEYIARARADRESAITTSDVICKLLRTQLLRKR